MISSTDVRFVLEGKAQALIKKRKKVLSTCEQIMDSPERIILEAMIEGFKQLNGHNSLKKIKFRIQSSRFNVNSVN